MIATPIALKNTWCKAIVRPAELSTAKLAKTAVIVVPIFAPKVIGKAFSIDSITTSILVPIVGSGILSIENAFPITLGANIGTTITAVLASFAVDNSAGLTIALHHVFFNAIGVAIIYPIQFIRNIPVNLAKSLAVVTAKRRYVAILYVLVTFLLLPLLGVVLFN